MFNFHKIDNPGFESFVRLYDLPPFVPIPRACEVLNKGRTSIYKLHSEKKLTIRNLAGTSGIFASELYDFLQTASPIENKKADVG